MIQTLRKIWQFSGSKKSVLAKSLIASILNAVFESLQFVAIMIALQTILGNQTVSHPVAITSLIMLVSILGKAATGYFSNQGMTEAGYYMCAEKRTHIADLMKYVPMGYFNETSMGNITAVLTSVMGDIENTAPRSLILMFGGFIQAVIVSAALLFFDVRIGLIMLVGIVCFLFATSLYNKRVARNAPKKQEAQTALVKNTMEFLGGIGVIKSFGLKGRSAGILRSIQNSTKENLRLEYAIVPFTMFQDDGFSGSNFDRPEFKRMIGDIEAGRVNCVIVKDLSRFGRDYIESGRYIQKVFPALSVRFIALTDHYDSFRADAGESGIVLPVKNFINDSYCRDISTKVKSQFEVKRKNGEYISSFAPYGYQKAEGNKNQLVIDSYAAEIVRKIFLWKIEGMASTAIATKLNGLGILSPKEYKKSIGLNFNGGFSGIGKAKWSSIAVKRILTNEVYLGHLVQGKTEKVNYKLKKSVEKPAAAWTKVENTHEAVISEDCFQIVQNLLQVDGRSCSDQQENNFFAGLLFCGDCKEQMVRRINWYNGIRKVSYICSTKNRGEGCSRHGISEEELKGLVMEMIRHYANCFLEEKRIFEMAVEMEADFESVVCCNTEIVRLKEEKKKYEALCLGLHEDLRRGIVTKEEFERLYREFGSKAAALEEAEKKQTAMVGEMFRNGVISAGILKTMQTCPELKEIDRYTLCSMVKRIYVFEGKRIEIEFYYADSYRIMLEANQKLKDKKKRIGRSA